MKVTTIFAIALAWSAQAATMPAGAQEAVDAVRALKSVTEVGVNYAQYAPRVLDAKVKVDQYLAHPPANDLALRGDIKAAMRYHEMVSQALNAKMVMALTQKTGTTEALNRNTQARHALADIGAAAGGDQCFSLRTSLAALTVLPGDDKNLNAGLFIADRPSLLWTCAAQQLAQADRLLQAK